MKNKIYPFLLGLSCIVIVALVSFKNSEKAVEKEQMIIIAKAPYSGKAYEMYISFSDKYESSKVETTEISNYSELLHKIEEYQKTGWAVSNSNFSTTHNGGTALLYTLEREKK
jgi:hypothetical protein